MIIAIWNIDDCVLDVHYVSFMDIMDHIVDCTIRDGNGFYNNMVLLQFNC